MIIVAAFQEQCIKGKFTEIVFAAVFFVLYINVTAKAMNPKLRIITWAGQQRYAQAMRNSGADEVIIPEHEGGLMVGRMIEKYSVV